MLEELQCSEHASKACQPNHARVDVEGEAATEPVKQVHATEGQDGCVEPDPPRAQGRGPHVQDAAQQLQEEEAREDEGREVKDSGRPGPGLLRRERASGVPQGMSDLVAAILHLCGHDNRVGEDQAGAGRLEDPAAHEARANALGRLRLRGRGVQGREALGGKLLLRGLSDEALECDCHRLHQRLLGSGVVAAHLPRRLRRVGDTVLVGSPAIDALGYGRAI
mmetsp:Transcript_47559/g.132223  ORF Transcript_47559/g.132223 Transcript_47559/m.132223 type:complete len:222 (+) Transcript_47559:883-1548(+)